MGTVVLADVTELTTVKFSELPELIEAADNDVVPILDKDILATKGIESSKLVRFLKSEYEELSEWLDDVTLGNDGLTSVPEMVLIPRASPLVDVVGGVYFSSIDKSVYVCTEI